MRLVPLVLTIIAILFYFMFQNEGTNPGSLVHSFGGVARNVAECMTRLGTPPFFISAVGNDQNGKLITQYLNELGMVRERERERGKGDSRNIFSW